MRFASFLLSLTLFLVAFSDAAARPATPTESPAARFLYRDEAVRTPPPAPTKSATDSLTLYGGEGTLEGKFENAGGQPDWQGWITVDRTDLAPFWHVSTFGAENLVGQGLGNHAMWCGRASEDAVGWASAPGYGNGWDQALLWTSGALADPDSAQTVQLNFYFNHDVEPYYDFFSVAYDSAGSWITVYRVDGRSPGPTGSFDPPGLIFSEQGAGAIDFAGGDYGGPDGDEIRLRLRVTSDQVWSDEDGLWETHGAVQVDNVSVGWHDADQAHLSFEDFESAGPYEWVPQTQPYVGDFAKLFTELSLPDPCSSNASVVATFIDDGRPPANPRNDPPVSTGGSLPTFINWDGPSYGIPEGWVINYTDGLSGGEARLHNQIWSPPILWDLPTSADDGPEWIGGLLEYDLQDHMPLLNGLFHLWQVRSSNDGGNEWSAWTSRNTLYFTSAPTWDRARRDLTGLIPAEATHVQISLGVQDLADYFEFGGNDATPGPWFDDVRVVKYAVSGPRMALEDRHHFQDSFAPSGLGDVSTAAARDALDVPLDIAETVDEYKGVDPGDSLVIEIQSLIGGVEVWQVWLHWLQEENPVFEPALRDGRPAGATLLPDSTEAGWARWQGSVLGQSPTVGGAPIANRRFFDLPDQDFFYPGDRIRYFVEAVDSGGHHSFLPPDTTGFSGGTGFDERFRVRALPTYYDDQGEQREILLVDETGREDAHDSLRELFAEIAAPRDFYPRGGADTYVVRAASSGLSNGIGSSGLHGATLSQLAGYDRILYSSGRLSGAALSDGSAVGGHDAGDDLGLLSDWHALAGDRGMAHLGSHLVSSLGFSGAGSNYRDGVLGVEYLGYDALDQMGNPQNVEVTPWGSPYFRNFILSVGCPLPRRMDAIAPSFLSTVGHRFASYEFDDFVASVWSEDTPVKTVIPSTLDVALTFPFDLPAIASTPEDATARGARKLFLVELGIPLGYGRIASAVDPPPRAHLSAVRLFPNPANPRVGIHFVMGIQDRVEAEIFDLRGRRVRTLAVQTLSAGPQRLDWDARDDRGQEVASGVYLVRLRTNGEERWNKVAIVK